MIVRDKGDGMTDNDAFASALEKIAAIGLSDAEINALAEAVSDAADDEVTGFSMMGPAEKGWNDVMSFSFGVKPPVIDFRFERGMKESGEKGGPPEDGR